MNRILELQYLIGRIEDLQIAEAIGDPEAVVMKEKLRREMEESERREMRREMDRRMDEVLRDEFR